MTLAAVDDPRPSPGSPSLLPAPSTLLETSLIDPLRDPEWDRLVLSHPDANIFHSTAWARVLSSTYGHEPFYLKFTCNGKLAALLPVMEIRSRFTGRRGVSLPFSDFCDSLVFEPVGKDFLFDTLTISARERNWKSIEVRGSAALDNCPTPFVSFHGHALDLRVGASECLARCSSSVRRAIRKAERSGLKVELSRTRETMLDFCRLHVRTRRRHGVPPQPRSFFLNIHKHVIEPGYGFVATARQGTSPTASAVFFHFGEEAVFKFGASDERLQRLRGNNLVTWEGIKSLAERGFKTLRFGRTSFGNHGLRRFKLGWGTQEEMIQYFKFDTFAGKWMPGRDNAFGFHTAIFRRLPLALNRMAGALIYPHLD